MSKLNYLGSFGRVFTVGHYGWLNLVKKPIITIKNKDTVYAFNCGDIASRNFRGTDIHPTAHIEFPDTKTVIMRGCDKNFTYYWLNKTVFPKSSKIYILDYPFDPEILSRFKEDECHVDAEFIPYHYNIDLMPRNVLMINKDLKREIFGFNNFEDKYNQMIDNLVGNKFRN